jgi:hypothetical protein
MESEKNSFMLSTIQREMLRVPIIQYTHQRVWWASALIFYLIWISQPSESQKLIVIAKDHTATHQRNFHIRAGSREVISCRFLF